MLGKKVGDRRPRILGHAGKKRVNTEQLTLTFNLYIDKMYLSEFLKVFVWILIRCPLLVTFCTTKVFVVFLFPDTFCIQLSPVSRYFPYSKVSKNRRNNKIPWKNHYFKGFCRFTVSRHFWIWKVSGYRWKDQIPWIRNVSINRKSDQILWIGNVSGNMETTKSF